MIAAVEGFCSVPLIDKWGVHLFTSLLARFNVWTGIVEPN